MATRTRQATVPSGYDPSEFPPFAVTVDVVILTMSDGVLHALLVRRGEEPSKGMWAIPGTKRPEETLDGRETRALRGDRRRRAQPADPVRRAYGDPGRDPRMNVVTVACLAVLRDVGAIDAGDGRSARRARPRLGHPRGEDPARVRLPADRPRRGRSGPGRARASRPPSSARPSRWPSSGRCTRRSGGAA